MLGLRVCGLGFRTEGLRFAIQFKAWRSGPGEEWWMYKD